MEIVDDKVVSFHYTLTDAQGEQIDSSRTQEPLTYLHGRGNLIDGLERAMAGKSAGATFEITLAPDDAYGQRDDNLVRKLDRDSFPSADESEVGMQFQLQQSDGDQVVTITEINDDHVTVDGNHPLAGETLNFEIEVTEVRDPTSEELSHGHAHGDGHHH
jgi:FKBP-type peptidyl-prolyl cis-trans isomerase SlyD